MRFSKTARTLSAATGLMLLTPALASAATSFLVPGEAVIPSLDRVSWSAVIAGAVVALATHLALSALGVCIGAAAVDPHNREHPIKGVPTAMLAWMFLSGLVALFVGGWLAGRLAGTAPLDSAIHGLVTWSLATVVMFVLATTSLGYFIGGAFHLLGKGATATASAAASVLPDAAGAVKDAIAARVPQFDWKAIEHEAQQLLSTPEQKQANADKDVGELLSAAYGAVREGLTEQNRSALVGALTERAGVTKDEANRTIDKWEKMYRDAKQQFQKVAARAEEEARDAAAVATGAVSRVSGWTFASLLLGATVATVAGNLGSTYFRI